MRLQNAPPTQAEGECVRAREEFDTSVLTRGAELQSCNGVDFDADGNLWIASVIGRALTKIDPESGEVLEQLGPEDGVEAPDDVLVGPDGSIYWTAFLTGEVGRIYPDGTLSYLGTIGPGCDGIAISDDGRLFASTVFLGDALYELDPDGFEAPRVVASGMGGLNAMRFGDDGLLYGPLWFLGQIVRFDVDTGAMEVVAGGLDTPAAVKFGSDGTLYVVDAAAEAVYSVDIDTGALTHIADTKPGIDNFALDAADRIYISSTHDGAITRIRPDGTLKNITRPGQVSPAGVTVQQKNGKSSVFVSDLYAMRELSPVTGRYLAVANTISGKPVSVNTPVTVESFGEGLVITSWYSNTVQIWDVNAKAPTALYPDFNIPMNAVEFAGDVVVAELGTGCVVRRPAGTYDREELACGFYYPLGMATSGDNLLVSDWASGVVWQVIGGGVVLPEPMPVYAGLVMPDGIAFDNEGRLLVVETGTARLLRIELATGATEVLREGLEVRTETIAGYPPSMLLNDVAVDSCGAIYVTTDGNGNTLRMVPHSWQAYLCLLSHSNI